MIKTINPITLLVQYERSISPRTIQQIKKNFFYEVMPSTQIQNVINIINKGLLSVYIYIIHSIETYTKVKVAVN